MPNEIALAKAYQDALDEVYKIASVTADLTSDASLVKDGANDNELLYPQMDMSGLGNYSRNSGYTEGFVSLVWETAKYNYDRGTKISVDTMDNQESRNIAFGMLGGELIRTKVAPEADAFTFSKLAGTVGISVGTAETFTDAKAFLKALLDAKNTMDEDEVPEEGRILYATPTLTNSLMSLDTTQSREAFNSFGIVKKVPQSRFYTAIDLFDGKSVGEELGHYKKATDGKDINFMIVHKPALLKWDKHIASETISPKINVNADAYIKKYRKYGIVDVYKNKVAGIYLSHKV